MRVQIDTDSATPPYEQIRQQILGGILAGVLPPGERLPPVRQLAADLGLAVSTVARAYTALETGGLVITGRSRGTRVAERELPHSAVNHAADDYIRAARDVGLDLPAMLAILSARHS